VAAQGPREGHIWPPPMGAAFGLMSDFRCGDDVVQGCAAPAPHEMVAHASIGRAKLLDAAAPSPQDGDWQMILA
jgi:hypothetical protein